MELNNSEKYKALQVSVFIMIEIYIKVCSCNTFCVMFQGAIYINKRVKVKIYDLSRFEAIFQFLWREEKLHFKMII